MKKSLIDTELFNTWLQENYPSNFRQVVVDVLDKYSITLVKETSKEAEMEEFFLSIFKKLTTKKSDKYPNSIFFMDGEKCFAEQDNKNKYFWIRYEDFWQVFETKFNMNYKETQAFLNGMLEKHLKLEGFTTNLSL